MMACCNKLFPVRMMCRLLQVSPSGYYASQRRSLSRRARENVQLTQEIRTIHEESDGVYGSLKLWQELQGGGMSVANIVWLDS